MTSDSKFYIDKCKSLISSDFSLKPSGLFNVFFFNYLME